MVEITQKMEGATALLGGMAVLGVMPKSGVLTPESSGDQIDVCYLNTVFELYLPIRLLPTPTKCGMRPFPGVKPVEGWRDCASRDSEQRAERVERIEAPIESKSELVEVGL
jgi:hypothetical protein